jgi:hypothetical protein
LVELEIGESVGPLAMAEEWAQVQSEVRSGAERQGTTGGVLEHLVSEAPLHCDDNLLHAISLTAAMLQRAL